MAHNSKITMEKNMLDTCSIASSQGGDNFGGTERPNRIKIRQVMNILWQVKFCQIQKTL